MKKATFKVFSASAGSGKTYALVQSYLEVLLSASHPAICKKILAVTFTNKAVEEMKSRILTTLGEFSNPDIICHPNDMFVDLCKSTKLPAQKLHERAKNGLQYIAHHYHDFNVSTIDRFTQKVVRTFAQDLKLSHNFEVSLDHSKVLSEAVDRFISKAGGDSQLTEIMLDFVFDKVQDDKSADISIDFFKMSERLLSENDLPILEQISTLEIKDHMAFKKLLKNTIHDLHEQVKSVAQSVLESLEEQEIALTSFPYQTLPNHFKKIAGGEIKNLYANKLEEQIEVGQLLSKKASEDERLRLDHLLPEIQKAYQHQKVSIHLLGLYQNFLSNITPLSVLKGLDKELEQMKLEQNFLLISEFNNLISNHLKNEPTAFIYERLGENYSHFFIDEFQDTSSLQWDNLKPLLENAVVSEDEKGQRGSLLLVGDAKQSIYRWRGGNAEQFIDLYENKAFPAAQPKVINLPNNFRSLFEIVQFNNRFFNYTAAYLERENFASLYRDGSHQKPQKESGGFVSLEFLDDDPDKEAHYCEKVLDAINASLDKGFSYGDICLLTRKKKHGVLLAQYLIEKQIPVISSESLLLDNHPKVRFLVQLIRFVYQETTPYQAYPLLAYLAQTQNKISVHEYIKKSLGNASEFFKSEFGFNPEALNTASIYDFCLMGIRSFSLANGKDAYLQFFLDVVSEVSLKEGGGPSVLLQYWEQKKSQLSVSAPDGLNAIQILTVHKAKGLEFPVVIFPFAETPLKEERNPTFWLPVPKEDFDGFEYLLLAKNDKIAQYNPLSKQIIEEEDQRLVLDALNILYVALTRASQALFVIGGMALNKDGKVNKNQYSGLLIDYLMDQGEWSAEKQRYTFGHFKMPEETTAAHKNDPKTIFFQLTQNTHERYALLMHPHTFVPEKVLQAQNLGQQLHYLLEQLDIHPLEKSLEKTSKAYPSADLGSLKTQAVGIISHEHLEKYYQKGLKAFNEKDIFTQNGSVARPDRLVFNENKVTVIDYKTGVEKEEDQVQIKSYGALLEEMGYQVENKILVYVDGARVLPIFV